MSKLTLGDGKLKPAYTWDFDGACAPQYSATNGHVTFSLGIFQWIPKKSGGVKRGKVCLRVKGLMSDPDAVREKARELAHQRNILRGCADD